MRKSQLFLVEILQQNFGDLAKEMSRLLTTLLLYRSGFYVGKYISLEAKIASHKDLYYDALSRSQNGWHEGKEDATPFIKYILSTILAAYRDFEDRFSIISFKQQESEPCTDWYGVRIFVMVRICFVNGIFSAKSICLAF